MAAWNHGAPGRPLPPGAAGGNHEVMPHRGATRVGDYEPLSIDLIQVPGAYCATKRGLGSFRVIHVDVRVVGGEVVRKPFSLDDRPLPSTDELRRAWVFYGPTDENYAKGFCAKFDAYADKVFV
jgi:hypothetical protein